MQHLLADRLDDAAALLAKVLAADPTDAQAHALEGFIHDLSGRSDMAIASFRAALYLAPELFQVRLQLGDALRRRGWTERAAVEYRALLSLLGSGAVRELEALTPLPLADAKAARLRARDALARR